ncbi:MAG TPA: alpha/beta fold hydrolase [Trebonia sp.]|nr:alpha/beta fold hydrolase [Trebonia sp.]
MSPTVQSGFASVNGASVYWESRGEGGPPLVLVHGGYGLASDFDTLAELWSRDRRVIGLELDGHGHSRASGRPLRWESLADDIAAVIGQLGLGQADLLGRSLGGGAALRCAIQHPELIRQLVLVSAPHRRSAWHPEIRAAFDGMTAATLFPQLSQSPLFASWRKVAPDPGAFPALIDATGDLLRQPYDWSDAVAALPMPLLLIYGDADSIPPSAAAEFHALLGGGQRDAGWDGSGLGRSRLAILPGATHYDILDVPSLPEIVRHFLG